MTGILRGLAWPSTVVPVVHGRCPRDHLSALYSSTGLCLNVKTQHCGRCSHVASSEPIGRGSVV